MDANGTYSVMTSATVYAELHPVELCRMLPDGVTPEAVYVRKLRPKAWFEAQRSLPLQTDSSTNEDWSDDQKLAYYDWMRRLCVASVDGARACKKDGDAWTIVDRVPLTLVYGQEAGDGQMTIDQFDFDDNVARVGQHIIWLAQNGGALADTANATF